MAEMIWQSVEPSMRELGFGFYMPADWQQVPLPDEGQPDFSNPTAMMPLAAFMATYAPIVFAVGVRPAYDDGTPPQWLDYLCREGGYAIESTATLRLGNVNAAAVTVTQSDGDGRMAARSRLALVHAGNAIINISATAPMQLWDGIVATLDQMMASFTMALVKHPPLETNEPLKTSEPPKQTPAEVVDTQDASIATDDAPTRPADVALADDAASFDPDHQTNAFFRDNGHGLVPRMLELNENEKYGVFGCGAIVATVRVPFGWHIVDDGRRVLVFDRGGDVQVNLALLRTEGRSLDQLADETVAGLSRELVGFDHRRLELMGLPTIAVRYTDENGDPLEQGYMFLAYPHNPELALKVRVTATPSTIVNAMNLAEVLLRDIDFQPGEPAEPEPAPPTEPPPVDTTIRAKGDPDWFVRATELEKAGKFQEAETVVAEAADKMGGPADAMIATLYENRYERLVREGRQQEAIEAARTACKWMGYYSSGATSGGEGTARLAEYNQFRAKFEHLL